MLALSVLTERPSLGLSRSSNLESCSKECETNRWICAARSLYQEKSSVERKSFQFTEHSTFPPLPPVMVLKTERATQSPRSSWWWSHRAEGRWASLPNASAERVSFPACPTGRRPRRRAGGDLTLDNAAEGKIPIRFFPL